MAGNALGHRPHPAPALLPLCFSRARGRAAAISAAALWRNEEREVESGAEEWRRDMGHDDRGWHPQDKVDIPPLNS